MFLPMMGSLLFSSLGLINLLRPLDYGLDTTFSEKGIRDVLSQIQLNSFPNSHKATELSALRGTAVHSHPGGSVMQVVLLHRL